MKKLSKSTYGFIFAIVALCILLALSLYLGISGWFFSNSTKIESDISIGQTVNLSVTDTGSKTVSFSLPGSYLPGQKIDQNINIINISNKDMFVRAKAVIFSLSEGETELELGTNEHWTQQGEYYYFDSKLPLSNKISLASFIRLAEDKYYSSSKRYLLTVVVETLDATLDRNQIWGYENE